MACQNKVAICMPCPGIRIPNTRSFYISVTYARWDAGSGSPVPRQACQSLCTEFIAPGIRIPSQAAYANTRADTARGGALWRCLWRSANPPATASTATAPTPATIFVVLDDELAAALAMAA